MVDILWPHKDTGLLVSCLFESCLSALSDCGCQDINSGCWELRNILGHSNEHSSSTKMVPHFNKSLSKLEGVDQHQLLVKIKWDFQVMGLNILESIEQNIMRILIVSNFLLLLRDVDSNLDSLLNISNSSV